MSAVEPEDDPDAALAAEYVLRLLSPAEEAECAARVGREPGFAALVALWRADLSAFDAEFPAVALPARLGQRIERRLFGATEARGGFTLEGLWNSVGLWRGLAAAALIAAAVLVAPLLSPEAAPRLVAAIAPSNSDLDLLAYFDAETGALDVNRVAGAALPGRALELWVIPETGVAPISLGVLPEAARVRWRCPPALAARIGAGAVLAVTDEPPGGSATGLPGTLLAAGPITAI